MKKRIFLVKFEATDEISPYNSIGGDVFVVAPTRTEAKEKFLKNLKVEVGPWRD